MTKEESQAVAEKLFKECFTGPLTIRILHPNDPELISAIKQTQEAQDRILKLKIVRQQSLDLRISI